jgi:hypothetical protein
LSGRITLAGRLQVAWELVRNARDDDTPEKALPASLAYQLIHEAGVPEAQVATMTLADAMAVMTEHWGKRKARVRVKRGREAPLTLSPSCSGG